MELKDFVNIIKRPAYQFINGFDGSIMYFIPICEYDTVEIDPKFDAFSYSRIIKDGEEVCHLKDLIQKRLLEGDPHLFIVPIKFGVYNAPEENIIYPDENS